MASVILFDLDNTLYSYDHCSALADAAVQAFCARQFGLPRAQTAAELTQLMRNITEEMGWQQAASHDRLIRFSRFLEMHGQPAFPYAELLYDTYWDTLLQAAAPEPGLVPFLYALRRLGFRLGCATNMTSRIQYRKLKKLGLGRLFDCLVTSEEACTEKPDPAFFHFAAARMGAAAADCVYIGDNYRLDVCGAAAAGMRAIHYQTPALAARHTRAPEGTKVIADYRDLDNCLRLTVHA